MIIAFFLVFIPTLLSADNGKRNHSYIGELGQPFHSRSCQDVYVDEQNGEDGNECINGSQRMRRCRSLTYALNHTFNCSFTTIRILTNITLNSSIHSEFYNRKNVAIVGLGWKKTYIICGWEYNEFSNSSIDAGFSLYYSINFTLTRLTLQSCGAFQYNNGRHLDLDHQLTFRSALFMRFCQHISLSEVVISSSNGIGLAMSNVYGNISVINSIFTNNTVWKTFESRLGGGGVFLHLIYEEKINKSINFLFQNCNLTHNIKKKPTIQFPGAESGGGMIIYLGENAARVTINIRQCNISHNKALWGGGMALAIVKDANDNLIHVVNTTFAKNNATKYHGGGGIDIGFYHFSHHSPPLNNCIEFENTVIQDNIASYGGGTTIYSAMDLNGNSSNTINFSNCLWKGNRAHFSAAIDIAPSPYDEIPGEFSLKPMFTNCRFINNFTPKVPIKDYNRTRIHVYQFGASIISITSIHTIFKGKSCFANNTGTALNVNSAMVIFEENTDGVFTNNSGSKGGAVSLVGISTFHFQSNSTFRFENNTAEVGGAIYSLSTNQHDYILSHTCFLKYWSREEERVVSDRNTTFHFINNTATSNIGNSIYVSTLKPCRNSCPDQNWNCSTKTAESVFNCCVAHFTFSPNQSNIINTMSYEFKDNLPLGNISAIIPGQTINLNLTVLDEYLSDVTKLSIFKVSTPEGSKVSIRTDYEYTKTGDVQIYGQQNSKGSIIVETNDLRGVVKWYDISLTDCQPGYTISKTGECMCQEGKFYGIYCNPNKNKSYALVFTQTWVGKNDEVGILSSLCPNGFCQYVTEDSKTEFIRFASLNSTDNCVNGREGVLCGKCKQGYSVMYHSIYYDCHQDKDACNYGFVVYILAELLPVTIIFIIVIVFNISFTSGALNGFVFFAQIGQFHGIYRYTSSKSVKLLSQSQDFFYGLFNLRIDMARYCLWTGATTLDVLAMKYVTITFSLILVLCLIILLKYCACYRVCSRMSFRSTIIHGLSAFLVMCYSQCARVTFSILRPSILWKEGPKTYNSMVVFMSGNIKFFGLEHCKYAIPALFFLVSFVFLPPAVLLYHAIISKFLPIMNRKGYCNSPSLTNRLLLIDLKPLLDSFQGCFKDRYRFFAGMYFLYRFLFLSLHIFSPTEAVFYSFNELFLIIVVCIHAIFQPYEQQWHNNLDTLLLVNLTIINGISLYLYLHSNYFGWTNDKHFFPAEMVFQSIQIILLFAPITYIMLYAGYKIYRRFGCFHSRKTITRSYDTSTDHWPERLLANHHQMYESFENTSKSISVK